MLRQFALQCDRIAELGVRKVVSSWAFLLGLVDASDVCNTRPKLLWCNDIGSCDIGLLQQCTVYSNITVQFTQGNDLTVPLPLEGFDMTFIDTWHVYGQLKRELMRFAPITRKYIAMHDTSIDALEGESIRMHMNVELQVHETGWPIQHVTTGLLPAITEFLESHQNSWEILYSTVHNNGLTVLHRIDRK